jgi:DNA replication protein DnaC
MEAVDSSNFSNFSKSELKSQQDALRNRFAAPITFGVSEVGKAHLKNLRITKTKRIEDVFASIENKERKEHKRIKHDVSYETARMILWKIFKEKLAAQNREFYADGNDIEVITNLLKYFIGDASSIYDLTKGICLMGNVGPGKTFLLESFQRFCGELGLKERMFKMVSTNDVYDKISSSGNKSITMSRFFKADWCFDDLGDEPLKYSDYGNELLFMIRIMTKRYEAFSRGKMTTHATSNLDVADLKERYGERFFDRFKQMFNVVVMTSQSKRK